MVSLCHQLWITASLTFLLCVLLLEFFEKACRLQPTIRKTSSILRLTDINSPKKQNEILHPPSKIHNYKTSSNDNNNNSNSNNTVQTIEMKNITPMGNNNEENNLYRHQSDTVSGHQITIDIPTENENKTDFEFEFDENSAILTNNEDNNNNNVAKNTNENTNMKTETKKANKTNETNKRKMLLQLLTLRKQNFPEFASDRARLMWRMTHTLDSKGRFRISRNLAMDYLNVIFDFVSTINLIVLAFINPRFYVDCFYKLKPRSIEEPLIQHQAVVIAVFYMFEICIKHGSKTDWGYVCHHLFTIMACIETICGVWFPEGLIYGATQIIMPGLVLDLVFIYRSQFSYKNPHRAKILLIIGYYWYILCVLALIFGEIYIVGIKIYFMKSRSYNWWEIIVLITFYVGCGQQDYIVANALREYVKWNYRNAKLSPREKSSSKHTPVFMEKNITYTNKNNKNDNKNINNKNNLNHTSIKNGTKVTNEDHN